MTAHLSRLQGPSSSWPSDAVFAEGWRTAPVYLTLNTARLVHILRRVSETFLTKKNERITIDGPLTVEHILPQSWIDHWPLAGSENGMTVDELRAAPEGDPRALATRRRNAAVHTLGNLTILTQELNSSVSNANWAVKKPELLKSSLLPINQALHSYPAWDETAIQARGEAMLQHALKIWPGPTSPGQV